jgi:proline iminopeptidase
MSSTRHKVQSPFPARSPSAIQRLLSGRSRGLAVGAAPAAGWGLLSGWMMPRGPLTTGEALTTMTVSLVIGIAAGASMRSRWAMLVAPVVSVVVFEAARLGAEGPTVDAVQASTYGIFAFIVGRGFHALLALTPMILGAAVGAGHMRRSELPSPRRRAKLWCGIRRSVAAVVGLALVALAALIARPASTAPIIGPDGNPAAGSITELTTVEAGGKDLGLMLRGSSTRNPVLLFLAGGPGGSELGAMRNHLPALEETFLVATLDQRGTGTSYRDLEPTSTLSLESYVQDTLSVTNYLRERFDQDRIYLMGQSGGTLHGILAVQRNPDFYRAFIGVGQMVSPLETDQIFYQDTLDWANRTGKAALAGKLEDIGPPPYESMLDYETALSQEYEVYPYDHTGNSEGEGGFSENFLAPEYTFTDQVHLLGAFMDTFAVLYPQLQDLDFRNDAVSLDVPVFFVQGAHEARGRAEPFREWAAVLEAPGKEIVEFENSGHRPLFEEPAKFVAYMRDTVLAGTPS